MLSNKMNDIEPSYLMPLIEKLYKLMENGKFKEIEKIFSEIDFSIEPEYLVTYLRATYPAKRLIDNWVNLRLAVRQELSSRGLDSDRMTRGL